MKIGLFCDFGEIPEIGTGHFYRSKWTSEVMKCRGHNIVNIVSGNDLPVDLDVLVIDDLRSQRNLMDIAIHNNTKIILIDGVADDIEMADLTISACFNPRSQYKGIEYMSFLPRGNRMYKSSKSTSIFVSMGGFDANNLAYTVIEALQEINVKIIVTKSINHQDFSTIFPNTEVFIGENYYIPMERCKAGIVNGGLTMFQALHFGLPSLVIPQYDHQLKYVQLVKSGCILVEHNKESILGNIKKILDDEELRCRLSTQAQSLVDGKAIERTCDLIEEFFA